MDKASLTPDNRAAKQRRLDALVAGIDEPMLKAVKKVVHENMSAREAYQFWQEEKAQGGKA